MIILMQALIKSLRRVRRRRAQLLLYKKRREQQVEVRAVIRQIKKRNIYDRVDYASTEWGKQMRDPRTADPLTKQG